MSTPTFEHKKNDDMPKEEKKGKEEPKNNIVTSEPGKVNQFGRE